MYKKFIAVWLCLCLSFPSVIFATAIDDEPVVLSEEGSSTDKDTNSGVEVANVDTSNESTASSTATVTSSSTETATTSTSTYTVVSGDYLRSIAARYLGSGDRYTEIVELNKDKYPSLATNPNLIYPGWSLTLPGDSTASTTLASTSNKSISSTGASNVSYQNVESAGLSSYTGGKLSPSEFIGLFGPVARDSMKETGVPASVTLAQAILETGWGKSSIGDAKNLFGIKGTGPAGTTNVHTQECYNGTYTTIKAGFRKYYTWQQSIDDHANLVSKGRYKTAWDNFQANHNADDFARGIHQAGYATSPTYSTNLINLMQKYNLYEWDSTN